MGNKSKTTTLFGKYLKKINARPAKIEPVTGIKPKAISLLSTTPNRTIYADEFYKIIYVANHQAGLTDVDFKIAVDEIFPNRLRTDLLEEFRNYSPEGLFIKKRTQQQSYIEEKTGIPEGKLSKYFGDREKRALALEIIGIAEGIGMDILEAFKEIYGPISEIETTPLPSTATLNERTNTIYQYIEAYNQSDVSGMVSNMVDSVVFVNIVNNQISMRLGNLIDFTNQATEALSYFSQRQQNILSMTHKGGDTTEITVLFKAVVALDAPIGLKQGDEIKLHGKSIFKFSETGKIVMLTDVS